MKVRVSNSILKSQADRLTRFLERQWSGRMLTHGSCRLCKKCARVFDEVCKKPNQMRYSLEALGLHVAEISRNYFSHPLLRYQNGKAPEYSSVLSAVLLPAHVVPDEIENKIREYGLTFNIGIIKV